MPSIPFNVLTAEPDTLYTAANNSIDFDVVLRNVGNATASYPLSAVIRRATGAWAVWRRRSISAPARPAARA